MTLRDFAWKEHLEQAWRGLGDAQLVPGRVITAHRGTFVVHTEKSEIVAELPGRMRHRAKSPRDLPAVGDWVVLGASDCEQSTTILHLLPRTTLFLRKEAGRVAREQVIAANVDYVLIVNALNLPFSPRRVERYLALVHDSGAKPVIVLSKSDLAGDADPALQDWSVQDVPIVRTSAITGEGIDELHSYISPGVTAAFVGSSGVGKSTLINRILGEERQAVLDIRSDGKGRHTTTRRELIPIPGGGVVLDTPGMRELQLWDSNEGLNETFDDIEELSLKCRFTNCLHQAEPGCAVNEAVKEGELPVHRLTTYQQFRVEMGELRQRAEEKQRAESRPGRPSPEKKNPRF